MPKYCYYKSTFGDDNPSIKSPVNEKQRFLLYIIPSRKGAGNSVQYEGFKTTMKIADYFGRTLVLTPFLDHGGMVRTFSKDNVRQFHETFDVAKLAQKLSVASMETFKASCNQNITVITAAIAFNKLQRDIAIYNETRIFYRNVMNISLPIFNNKFVNFSEDILQSDVMCVGILQLRSFNVRDMSRRFNRVSFNKELNSYLVKAPYIMNAANQLQDTICPGNSYFAFHWRNKTGERCFFGDEECPEDFSESFSVLKFGQRIGTVVGELMDKHNLTCIYVAHPSWSKEIVNYLSLRIPRKQIFSFANITATDFVEKEEIVTDFYKISLLEKEICARGKYFLGVAESTWSRDVVEERNQYKLLSTYLELVLPFANKFLEKLPTSVWRRTIPKTDVNN
ncbi:uncharacterized protein LOC144360346 [Saccoglossus kowalevskii]